MRKLLQAHKKCVMRMKVEVELEKNNTCVKMFLKEFISHVRRLVPWIAMSFKSMTVDTMKMLFV